MDEKKYLGTTEPGFRFNDLDGEDKELQNLILSFSTGEELATNVAPTSKALNNLSSKNPAYYLNTPGERGAALCRNALKLNPGDIKARNRLAFLLAMHETWSKHGDPEELKNPTMALEQNWLDHHDLESGYYRAKIGLEFNDIGLSKDIFIELLQNNPDHPERLGALCGLANLTHRGAIGANQTDFLFPNSTPSPHSWTPGYSRVLKNRAFAIYQMARAIHPNKNHEILCSLAKSLCKSYLVFRATEFQKYASFIDPNAQPVVTNDVGVNYRLAARCYRKILRKDPKHFEAVCGLAQLIGNRLVAAQAGDFLPEEQINGQMPDTLYDKELALFGRIQTQHAYATKYIENCQRILDMPLELWPDHLRPHRTNFKNLTYHQRALLGCQMCSALHDYYQYLQDHRDISDKKISKELLSVSSLPLIVMISTLGLIPLYLIAATQLDTTWRALSLVSLTALHVALLGACLYWLKTRLEDHVESSKEGKKDAKDTILRFSADDTVLPILYPELRNITALEKKALRRLWEIPEAKWNRPRENFITNFFIQGTVATRQPVVDQILQPRSVSNHHKVIMARVEEEAGRLALPLVMLAASGYGMYKTYGSLLNNNLAESLVILPLQGLAAFVLAIPVYFWIKNLWEPELVEKAEKSVRDDLIMTSINSQPLL